METCIMSRNGILVCLLSLHKLCGEKVIKLKGKILNFDLIIIAKCCFDLFSKTSEILHD